MVALIDKGQADHRICKATLKSLTPPLITTWPCITETMHFLKILRGWEGQNTLWTLIERDMIRIHVPNADEWKRVRELMEQYRDTPMACADASLVALAEFTGFRTVFTLDNDFYVYRIHGKDSFEVIPPRG
jgi:uncharacterized protein